MTMLHQGSQAFPTRVNGRWARLAGWRFDPRWRVLVISLVLLVGGLWLAGTVRQDNSAAGFFSGDDGAGLLYESSREDFGSGEVSDILDEVPGFEHGPWKLEGMRELVMTFHPFGREGAGANSRNVKEAA